MLYSEGVLFFSGTNAAAEVVGGAVFLLFGVGLRFVFPKGLRKINGQLFGGLAKSVTEKKQRREGAGRNFSIYRKSYWDIASSLPLLSTEDEYGIFNYFQTHLFRPDLLINGLSCTSIFCIGFEGRF